MIGSLARCRGIRLGNLSRLGFGRRSLLSGRRRLGVGRLGFSGLRSGRFGLRRLGGDRLFHGLRSGFGRWRRRFYRFRRFGHGRFNRLLRFGLGLGRLLGAGGGRSLVRRGLGDSLFWLGSLLGGRHRRSVLGNRRLGLRRCRSLLRRLCLGSARCFGFRLGLRLRFRSQLGGISLDEHALLAHLHLDRARAARPIGLPDL
jgi:hypothetical protein